MAKTATQAALAKQAAELTAEIVATRFKPLIETPLKAWLEANPTAEKLEEEKAIAKANFSGSTLESILKTLEESNSVEAAEAKIRDTVSLGLAHICNELKLSLKFYNPADLKQEKAKGSGETRNRRKAEAKEADQKRILDAVGNASLSSGEISTKLSGQANITQDLQALKKDGKLTMTGELRNAKWSKPKA